jgi:hypothetical protein
MPEPLKISLRLPAILSLVVAFFLLNCGNLDRDNPLDPQNPEGERNRLAVIEVFINDSDGEIIQSAVDGILQLTREYGTGKVALLEHHIEKSHGTDVYALETSLQRYLCYTLDSPQGLPHLFFDGPQHQALGAFDKDIAYQRYRSELEQRLSQPAHFTIEGSVQLVAGRAHVRAEVARLGNEDAKNINIYAIISEPVFGDEREVVRHIELLESYSALKKHQVVEVDKMFSIQSNISQSKSKCVIIIQDSNTFEIHQSAVFLTA